MSSSISALVLEHVPRLEGPPSRLSSFAFPHLRAVQPAPLAFNNRACHSMPRTGSLDVGNVQGWHSGWQGQGVQAKPELAAGQAHSGRGQQRLEQEQRDHFYARSHLLVSASPTLATLFDQVCDCAASCRSVWTPGAACTRLDCKVDRLAQLLPLWTTACQRYSLVLKACLLTVCWSFLSDMCEWITRVALHLCVKAHACSHLPGWCS